jgi:transposase
MELRMSAKERDRLDVMSRVLRKELSLMEASGELGVSYRQVKRVWRRFKAKGAAGLIHLARGRPSNNRLPEEVRDRIVKRHQERYADFGETLACEKLADDKLTVHPDTLRSILKERGLHVPRRHRSKHRRRRERRGCFGSMVQMDGSHHDWFEGRAAKCVLMVLIDDASNVCLARFYPAEDLAAAFDALGRWCRSYGIPRSLYVDRDSIYRDAKCPWRATQFGRALKELGVKLICAHSPQAKGRVERRNRVFQDRLVKELRLRGIRSMVQANLFLEGKFLAELNGRFAVEPRRSVDLHRPLPGEQKLAEILCRVEPRSVGNDWCVRWKNRWLQIDAEESCTPLAGKKVEVRELAGGDLLVSHQGRRLRWTALADRPRKQNLIVNNQRWRPGPGHPWVDQPACKNRPAR